MSVIKNLIRVLIYFGLAILTLAIFCPDLLIRLRGGTRGQHIRQQRGYGAAYNGGNTNVPLLAMDWFGEHGVHFCRVSQAGGVHFALDAGHAIQGGRSDVSKFAVGSKERQKLLSIMDNLRPSLWSWVPTERKVLVSGVRSNQWFEFVYDRANLPLEVESLYRLTGADLEWFVPMVGWQPHGVEHSMSQRPTGSFAIAQAAPVAALICNGCQIWNLARAAPKKLGTLNGLPFPWSQRAGNSWSSAAISADGSVIFVTDMHEVFAVDWKAQSLLWNQTRMPPGNPYPLSHGKLVIGNHGKSLFIIEGDSIQRWNPSNGKEVSILTTNASGIRWMESSQDGGLLLASFGDNSFAVWKTESDTSVFRFTETNEAKCAAISPDNRRIVLNGFVWGKLVVYEWPQNKREEFPLRPQSASSSAFGLFWSPKGDRLAAYMNTYPASIFIYETTAWKPIAHWPCGAIGTESKFVFNSDGTLFQLMDGDMESLDVSSLKPIAD